jgi:hypothetical protein
VCTSIEISVRIAAITTARTRAVFSVETIDDLVFKLARSQEALQ